MNNILLSGEFMISRYSGYITDISSSCRILIIMRLTVSRVFSTKSEFLHPDLKRSLGENSGESLQKSLGFFILTQRSSGDLLVHAQRILSSARESEVWVGDETQTEDKDSGEEWVVRDKGSVTSEGKVRKALNVIRRIWNSPLWACKFVNTVLSLQNTLPLQISVTLLDL